MIKFASNIFPVLKNVQVALTDTDKGSHKAKQKELRFQKGLPTEGSNQWMVLTNKEVEWCVTV